MNITKIKSIELTKITAYLAGVIIGDGHISNSTKSRTDKSKDYRIAIDLADKSYLQTIHQMIKSVVTTKSIPKPSKIRGNRKERIYFNLGIKASFIF